MVREPAWLTAARADMGVRELAGAPTAPRIAQMLARLRAWWTDDETPWCGTAVAAWMQAAGIEPPAAWYRAKAWAAWGHPIASPAIGCVVVFERAGGGHVGLAVGRDMGGRLLILGGNQGDKVCIAPFDPARAIAFRWPERQDMPIAWQTLPLMVSSAASSSNEA